MRYAAHLQTDYFEEHAEWIAVGVEGQSNEARVDASSRMPIKIA